MDSYGKFMELAMNPKETGAYLRQSIFYFNDKNLNIYHITASSLRSTIFQKQLEKMDELSHLPGFRHDAKLIEETAVNTDTDVVDAYQHMAPMVDTVTYMQWLYKQCREKGCHFVQDEIHGLFRDQAEDLKRKYKAQLIFNCSGLSAKELAGDE
ncbi:hypothetical protein OS493_004111 [Desmophyllum pertusum]|uniref:Uncharacterized protein n=1 Tax=Desmophyllum pertusum TaxID=174260 RepID=A0A9W9ZTJ5_9CNID|nr:hypothetical protein OS493_004111 [Desmophyllum pertusum]